MKYFFLLIAFGITIRINAQQVALTPAAKIVFKDVKSKLTHVEKNLFSNGVYVQKQDRTRLTVDPNGEDQGVFTWFYTYQNLL